MAEMKKPVFETLNAVNCNEHTEKKNGLTYLSWAWAWAEVKKRYPGATYIIYENPDGWPYWTDGRYCWVKVGVIIEGIEHIEYLPIMDNKNFSIPYEKVTTMDMNKAIQRGLTKAAARHGLGLYIYAGEDLPENEAQRPAEEAPAPKTTKTSTAPAKAPEKKEIGKQDLLPGGRTYKASVAAHAKGQKAKDGSSIRDAWAKAVKATQEQVDTFDHDVQTYRLDNNLKGVFEQ